MKTMHIRFLGERALFRNIAVPGADVADANLDRRTRAIHGMLGNMLGLWRDFDNTEDFDLAPELKKWIAENNLVFRDIKYPPHPEIRILGQHRYKDTANYMKPGESGPKNLTYHWDVQLDILIELTENGAKELKKAVLQPTGTPYLGQSNCPAQVFIVEENEI